jgi:hypothetical protein
MSLSYVGAVRTAEVPVPAPTAAVELPGAAAPLDPPRARARPEPPERAEPRAVPPERAEPRAVPPVRLDLAGAASEPGAARPNPTPMASANKDILLDFILFSFVFY